VNWEEDEGGTDEGDGIADTIACPYCQEDIYEDSQRCPHCENYISGEVSKRTSHPSWVVITAWILVAVFLYFALAPLLSEFL
jgi:predicted nucleic acid-binding Zn ribbon protein